MEYRNLHPALPQVSALGLGTWPFSGDATWGSTDEASCVGVIDCALEHGINLIDTAPIYGIGRAEQVVGQALRHHDRSRVYVATKCGLRKNGNRITVDLSPEFIDEEIDRSRRFLNTDYIDLYQCHWPDPTTPVRATVDKLMDLVRSGTIRAFGVSNFSKAELNEIADLGPVASLQSQLSLLDRGVQEKGILSACHDRGIGFLAYGPLAGGILSGKYRTPPALSKADVRQFFYKHYQGRNFDQAQALVARLSAMGHPLHQTAINWVRQQPGVTSVLIGARTTDQLLANIAAFDWTLSETEMSQIGQALNVTP